jgi:hypothetical protein
MKWSTAGGGPLSFNFFEFVFDLFSRLQWNHDLFFQFSCDLCFCNCSRRTRFLPLLNIYRLIIIARVITRRMIQDMGRAPADAVNSSSSDSISDSQSSSSSFVSRNEQDTAFAVKAEG